MTKKSLIFSSDFETMPTKHFPSEILSLKTQKQKTRGTTGQLSHKDVKDLGNQHIIVDV